MLRNYLTVALRTLLRHKLSTVINVVGLSIGIAVCIIIMLFIRHEMTYDLSHEHHDRIFRVLTERRGVDGAVDVSAWQPMPVTPALKAEFPEVLYATRFTTGGTIISRGEHVFEETVHYMDPDFFRMFTFPIVEGNRSRLLESPDEVVISRETARKYFGAESPIGKTLHIRSRGGEADYTVAAVVGESPSNRSHWFSIASNLRRHSMYERSKERWTSSNGSAFIQLADGVTGPAFDEKLPAFVDKYFGATIQRWQDAGNLSEEEGAWSMSAQPLADMRLNTSVGTSPEEKGNPAYLYILAGIGLLVLSIACINFVTLAVGRAASRAREVGLRKVLGAVRRQLVTQFWGEAVLLCVFSMGVGLLLAELFLPTFSNLANTTLSLDILRDGVLWAGLVGLLLVVGIAAGSYPAFYLSRFEPVETLKGKLTFGGKGFFTKALIVFQFGLSIFLMCSAIVLNDQLQFLISKNLGFKPEKVVVIPTYGGDSENAARIGERFRARVGESADILSVSLTSGAFTHGYDINGFQIDGENKNTFVYRVDESYLTTLGIPLKEGRTFRMNSADDRERGMIVNESFVKMMGWPEPAVGRRIEGSDSKMMEGMEVIGVVPDFHFTDLRQEIRPVMLFMNPEWPLDHILARVSPGSLPATMQYLRSVWREVHPGAPFNPTFLDEDFRKEYESEMRWGRMVTTASVLAISLACLGLFGMITIVVTNRTREIGIRKVLGASGAGIVRLVTKEFLLLVLFGNVIAWPAAYFAASGFLQNYAYRIDISPVSFVLAALAAVVVAFLAIGGHVIRAARSNPVESLRYE